MMPENFAEWWRITQEAVEKLRALEEENRTTHEMLSRQIEALRAYCDRLDRQFGAMDADYGARVRSLENAR